MKIGEIMARQIMGRDFIKSDGQIIAPEEVVTAAEKIHKYCNQYSCCNDCIFFSNKDGCPIYFAINYDLESMKSAIQREQQRQEEKRK